LLIRVGRIDWRDVFSIGRGSAHDFIIIAFSLITFLHIVFGELAPKTAALEISEEFLLVRAAAANFLQRFLLSDSSARLDGNENRAAFRFASVGRTRSVYTEDEIRHTQP
jgi:hypothetical protein